LTSRIALSLAKTKTFSKPFGRSVKNCLKGGLTLVLTASIILSPIQSYKVMASTVAQTKTLTDADLASAYSKTSVDRVSVHDPSIISDGKGTYYIFGSHLAFAKSTDLKNWTTFTNNITTNYKTIFAKEFNWAKMGDSAYDPAGNMWAPDVIYNTTLKKWCMYMSINGCSWNSSIAMLTADSLDGDWTYVGPVIYSGFTDANNNHDFANTDFTKVTGLTTLPSRYISTKYTCTDNSTTTATTTWNNSYGAHAIDPTAFYGQDGKLYMTYGSWSGGIYIIQLNPSSGLRDTTVSYNYSEGNSDPYMGIKLAGGSGTSGEASYVQYIDGNYYLFISDGGLVAKGGYNVRVYKASNPEGPYTDVSGQSPKYSTYTVNTNNDVGTRLMSYYKWNYQKYAQVAQGHNSAFVDSDGKSYIVYHTRTNDGSEGFTDRVHQLFTTKNHYLVEAPFEYNGETVSKTGYAASSVAGSYEVILQKQNINYSNLEYCSGQNMTLNADGTISGDYTGTWTMDANSPYVTLNVGGTNYEGLFVEQTIEGTNVNTMAFTVVGSNDVCIWGAKYPADEVSIAMAKDNLSIASETYSNITLPTASVFGATVSWSSSNTAVIGNDGKVTTPAQDTNVTMTATISKNNKVYTKDFNVLVHKAIKNDSTMQLLGSAFVNDPHDLSTKLDGSLSVANPYSSISNLDVSKGIKIKFDVQSTGTKNALGTIISFMDGGNGKLYFTPGSYLGYNATGGWYDANISNYKIATDYLGDSKDTVEISLTTTGFEVDVNGVKAYDQSIIGDSTKGSGTLSDYYNVLTWISTTADKVYFGKGSWWTDQAANCSISNVYFYGYLLQTTKMMSDVNGMQVIGSAFVNKPQDLTQKTDGTLSIKNPYIMISNLDATKGAKIKFDVQSTGTKNVLGTIISFLGNGGTNGKLYFTPGSYLGYNALGGWYDANVSNYKIVKDYIGDSKATVEISLTTTGFEVDVNGIKAYDQSILSDSTKGAGTLTDYSKVLTWLTSSANDVYFGKGSWWTDQANCNISNVYFYGYVNDGSSPTAALSNTTYTYDSTPKTPSVTVTDGSKALVEGTDYSVTYTDNINIGTATATIVGKGNYTGTIIKTFSITPKDITPLEVTLDSYSYDYDGTAKTPVVTVKDGAKTLVAGTDYTVSYSANINPGTGTVTITGIGIYSGTKTENFTINPKDSTKIKVKLDTSSYIYDGKAKTPTVSLKDGGKTLVEGIDYTVSYTDNINAGTGKVIITGKGGYTEVITKTFAIKEKVISRLDSNLENCSYVYDGTAKTPKVTLKDGAITLIEGTDYIITYADNTHAGIATVKVEGKGNYKGSLTKNFIIKGKEISELSITLGTCFGKVIVKDGNTSLREGKDYTLFYFYNFKLRAIEVIIIGEGDYTGSVTKSLQLK
jgi:beta-xylosidase